MDSQALGLLETIGLVTAVEAADTAAKAADVQVKELQFAGQGLVTVVIRGDISSVKSAIDAAERAARRLGPVQSTTVIGRTADGLSMLLGDTVPAVEEPVTDVAEIATKVSGDTVTIPDPAAMKKMKVTRLRQLARGLEGFPMDRKEINFARKATLVKLLVEYKKNLEK